MPTANTDTKQQGAATVAPQPQPETAPSSPARLELKASIKAVDTAKQAVQAAQDVVARAEAAVETSRARVATFSDLDSRLIQFRVKALKAGQDSSVLPAELRDQQLERLRSQEELSHAEATRETVKAELADVIKALESAEASQGAAAVGVYTECVQVHLDHLVEVDRLRAHLHLLLKGCGVPSFVPSHWAMLNPDQRQSLLRTALRDSGLPFGDPAHWEELYGKILRAFKNSPDVGDSPKNQALLEEARTHWRSFADELLKNPDAVPGLPPVLAWRPSGMQFDFA
jgi:hypothetical protein